MVGTAGTSPEDTPPDDPRPRPRYGELAPEGWTWKPPEDLPGGSEPAAVAPPPPPPAPSADAGRPAPRGVPDWDRPVALGLLILGLLGTYYAVAALSALPESFQRLHSQLELGKYAPAPSVAPLILTGIIVETLVWLASSTASLVLLRRAKRAFYVPLIGAAVSFVVIFVFMLAVLSTDPTLIDFVNRP